MKIPASVFILTFNSAMTLRRALESVKDFDDILIVDGGSTDATLDIARAFGARIVPQDSHCLTEGRLTDFACARNGALRHTKYPWGLFIDSDETASEALVREISDVVRENPRAGAFRIKAGIVLDGAHILRSSNYPGYQLRFFHKEAGQFVKPIHERFRVKEEYPIRTLKNPWHYYVTRGDVYKDFDRDLVRDMPLYGERYRGASLGKRMRGVLLALRSSAGIALRGLLNAIFYGGPSTYPFRLEWLRIRYQWAIIRTLL